MKSLTELTAWGETLKDEMAAAMPGEVESKTSQRALKLIQALL